MKITEYKTFLNEDRLCHLSKVKNVDYPEDTLNNPQLICKMLRDVFHMDALTEEYVFLLSFDTKYRSVNVLEVSHGTIDCSIVQPREAFQKALLSNAASIVIAHNHPSGDPTPSEADRKFCRSLWISESGSFSIRMEYSSHSSVLFLKYQYIASASSCPLTVSQNITFSSFFMNQFFIYKMGKTDRKKSTGFRHSHLYLYLLFFISLFCWP